MRGVLENRIEQLEAPPGFEPGMEVVPGLRASSFAACQVFMG